MSLDGLYAITDATHIPIDQFHYAIEQALLGGANIIQYRDKSGDKQQRFNQAQGIRTLCQQHNALCIINDDVELAKAVNADGVHIGQDDCRYQDARAHLGKSAIIGVSCYADLDRAQEAQQQGVDYVAFGRFFPSSTKPNASPAPIDVLTTAKQSLHLPICAIGGITHQNAPSLIAAGADMVAVIGDLFTAPDIRTRATAFRNLF